MVFEGFLLAKTGKILKHLNRRWSIQIQECLHNGPITRRITPELHSRQDRRTAGGDFKRAAAADGGPLMARSQRGHLELLVDRVVTHKKNYN